MRPPFRADHVGSLLRPPELLRAREDFSAGRISADELRGIENTAIREVVRRQQEAGLRSATDGELRRESWHMDFIYQLGGVRSAIDATVYPDLDQFWADLVAAYALLMRRLYDLGCRYLQFDDTSLAYMNDPVQRQHVAEIGGDPQHQHEQYIANINRVLAGRPADLAVTTHMCRGNNQSMWAAEGSYEFVAEALFGTLDVDGFFCEWDDERSGGFEPLRFVPKGKRVVLGLVTTKRGELEKKDDLKRRIDAAARFTGGDQLCLSPQCGFSSTKEGNDLTQEQQWAKLALIVETAQEVWSSW